MASRPVRIKVSPTKVESYEVLSSRKQLTLVKVVLLAGRATGAGAGLLLATSTELRGKTGKLIHNDEMSELKGESSENAERI